MILWIAIIINALDVKAAEVVLKYLTYTKLGALAMVTVIGLVFIGKNGTAVHQNLSNSFENSSLFAG